jgi:hypothetical protein
MRSEDLRSIAIIFKALRKKAGDGHLGGAISCLGSNVRVPYATNRLETIIVASIAAVVDQKIRSAVL